MWFALKTFLLLGTCYISHFFTYIRQYIKVIKNMPHLSNKAHEMYKIRDYIRARAIK